MDHSGHHSHADAPAEPFPTDPAGLPAATTPAVLELGDGDSIALAVGPVAKTLGDTTVRMLAYNGSVPGPTLVVRQGTELIVDVTNDGDLDTTVHWHGLRLDNRSDGVPHDTQAPIPVGGRFTYTLRFPDAGLYWYHPHIREDYTQELGLYGTILVRPADDGYWPRAHRDVVLTLDDLLLEDGRIAPFSPAETTHAAMGRFGNVFLTGGQTAPAFAAAVGEVVRFWLVDTANTRVFNVRIPGARMKLVGGDSGRVEHEEFVDEVIIAPSERAVVDVLFPEPGEYALEHRTPAATHRLATVTVAAAGVATPSLAESFGELRSAPELAAERAGLDRWLAAEPDEILSMVAEMHLDHGGHGDHGGPVTYTCPMHPEVTSDAPGHCPHCHMKLLPSALVTEAEHAHGQHEHDAHDHGQHEHEHHHDAPTTADGIEWEDDMVEVNRMTTPATMHWRFVDPTTGAAPDWRFTVGQRVKLRLVNELESDHPMHHPFHLHGAGRFLVLARDGRTEPNLVWKDTVLVRTGQTVDLLFDVTNPGLWMAHCHIAEHMESGMMFGFTVDN